jgi:hypothetical protein
MSDIDDLDAFIAAGTRLLGLRIRPEWRDAIRLHLAVSLDHAKTVAEFALPDDAEPAAVFSA